MVQNAETFRTFTALKSGAFTAGDSEKSAGVERYKSSGVR